MARAIQDVQLFLRRRAEAVDKDGDLVTRPIGQIIDDGRRQLLGDLIRGLERSAAHPRLAVDPHPDLHLPSGQIERGYPGGGQRARGQGHAHAPDIRRRELRDGGHLAERGT
jgi:hypothetical protein